MSTSFKWEAIGNMRSFFWVGAFTEPVSVGLVKKTKEGKFKGICCNGDVGDHDTQQEAMDAVEHELWMFAAAINGHHVDKQMKRIAERANKPKGGDDEKGNG